MSDMKNKSVAVTGHRVLLKNFDEELLKKTFIKLLEEGFEYFYIGMALGFDMKCFEVLSDLKKSYPLKIVACLPCLNQDAKWNGYQKKVYRDALKKSDIKVVLADDYFAGCMAKRNEFMVDKVSILVAYIYKSTGGAYQTAKYAVEKGIKIIYV